METAHSSAGVWEVRSRSATHQALTAERMPLFTSQSLFTVELKAINCILLENGTVAPLNSAAYCRIQKKNTFVFQNLKVFIMCGRRDHARICNQDLDLSVECLLQIKTASQDSDFWCLCFRERKKEPARALAISTKCVSLPASLFNAENSQTFCTCSPCQDANCASQKGTTKWHLCLLLRAVQ